MIHTRVRWTAVAVFAAVMTIAEVFAIQAAARDAKKWLASDEARGIRQAGRAVAAAVTGAATRDCGLRGREVQMRVLSREEIRAALRDARRQLEATKQERSPAIDI